MKQEKDINTDCKNQHTMQVIKDILQQKGISQRAFAHMLNKSEVEIIRWLNGKMVFHRPTS